MFFQWVWSAAIWLTGLVLQVVRPAQFYPVIILGGLIQATGNKQTNKHKHTHTHTHTHTRTHKEKKRKKKKKRKKRKKKKETYNLSQNPTYVINSLFKEL
jgi:flagellar biosynthesis component FlhA